MINFGFNNFNPANLTPQQKLQILQNRTKRDGDVESQAVKATPRNNPATVIDLSSEEGDPGHESSPEEQGDEHHQQKQVIVTTRPKNVPKPEEINEMFSQV